MGLVPVAAGSVQIFGRAYDEQRNLVGYVPQRGSVGWDFPTNALDVVMMGTYGRLGWIRRPGKAQRETAMHCLEQLGMADYADRQISQLSGGQQQRVFLARRAGSGAELYFMDEPFVGVDATTRARSSTCCGSCARAARLSSASTTTWNRRRTISTGWCCSTCASSPTARSTTFTPGELGQDLRRPHPPAPRLIATGGALQAAEGSRRA